MAFKISHDLASASSVTSLPHSASFHCAAATMTTFFSSTAKFTAALSHLIGKPGILSCAQFFFSLSTLPK